MHLLWIFHLHCQGEKPGRCQVAREACASMDTWSRCWASVWARGQCGEDSRLCPFSPVVWMYARCISSKFFGLNILFSRKITVDNTFQYKELWSLFQFLFHYSSEIFKMNLFIILLLIRVIFLLMFRMNAPCVLKPMNIGTELNKNSHIYILWIVWRGLKPLNPCARRHMGY